MSTSQRARLRRKRVGTYAAVSATPVGQQNSGYSSVSSPMSGTGSAAVPTPAAAAAASSSPYMQQYFFCPLYVHNTDFSTEEFIINSKLFPWIREGMLVELFYPSSVKSTYALYTQLDKSFQTQNSNLSSSYEGQGAASGDATITRQQHPGQSGSQASSYVFSSSSSNFVPICTQESLIVYVSSTKPMRSTYPISLAKALADLYEFRSYSTQPVGQQGSAQTSSPISSQSSSSVSDVSGSSASGVSSDSSSSSTGASSSISSQQESIELGNICVRVLDPEIYFGNRTGQIGVDGAAFTYDDHEQLHALMRDQRHEPYVLEYVELSFKDQYISRSDMWRFTLHLYRYTAYIGKIYHWQGMRAAVRALSYCKWNKDKNIWETFQRKSGYINHYTKFTFRSKSANIYLLFYMSREMWQYDHCSSDVHVSSSNDEIDPESSHHHHISKTAQGSNSATTVTTVSSQSGTSNSSGYSGQGGQSSGSSQHSDIKRYHFNSLYFEKAVDGLMSELFERWHKAGVYHNLNIILFSRHFVVSGGTEHGSSSPSSGGMSDFNSGCTISSSDGFPSSSDIPSSAAGQDSYDADSPANEQAQGAGSNTERFVSMTMVKDGKKRKYFDFYKVLSLDDIAYYCYQYRYTSSDAPSGAGAQPEYQQQNSQAEQQDEASYLQAWKSITMLLKKEFIEYRDNIRKYFLSQYERQERQRGLSRRQRIPYCQLINSTSADGNFLEATNLVLHRYDSHHINRDLHRTGQLIVLVTAGTGVFNIRQTITLATITKQRLTDNGIAIDIISLCEPPLHAVPIFRFIKTSNVGGEDKLSFNRAEDTPGGLRRSVSGSTQLRPGSNQYKEFCWYRSPDWAYLSFYQPSIAAVAQIRHQLQHSNDSVASGRKFVPTIRMPTIQQPNGFHYEYISKQRPNYLIRQLYQSVDNHFYSKSQVQSQRFVSLENSSRGLTQEALQEHAHSAGSSAMSMPRRDSEGALEASPANSVSSSVWETSTVQSGAGGISEYSSEISSIHVSRHASSEGASSFYVVSESPRLSATADAARRIQALRHSGNNSRGSTPTPLDDNLSDDDDEEPEEIAQSSSFRGSETLQRRSSIRSYKSDYLGQYLQQPRGWFSQSENSYNSYQMVYQSQGAFDDGTSLGFAGPQVTHYSSRLNALPGDTKAMIDFEAHDDLVFGGEDSARMYMQHQLLTSSNAGHLLSEKARRKKYLQLMLLKQNQSYQYQSRKSGASGRIAQILSNASSASGTPPIGSSSSRQAFSSTSEFSTNGVDEQYHSPPRQILGASRRNAETDDAGVSASQLSARASQITSSSISSLANTSTPSKVIQYHQYSMLAAYEFHGEEQAEGGVVARLFNPFNIDSGNGEQDMSSAASTPLAHHMQQSTTTSHYRRWSHLYPNQVFSEKYKLKQYQTFFSQQDELLSSTYLQPNWTSLVEPAVLPLTSDFWPDENKLKYEYSTYSWNVMPNNDLSILLPGGRQAPLDLDVLLRELIYYRLHQGFQLHLAPTRSKVVSLLEESLANAAATGQPGDDLLLKRLYQRSTHTNSLSSAGIDVRDLFLSDKPNVFLKKHADSIERPLSLTGDASSGTSSSNAASAKKGGLQLGLKRKGVNLRRRVRNAYYTQGAYDGVLADYVQEEYNSSVQDDSSVPQASLPVAVPTTVDSVGSASSPINITRVSSSTDILSTSSGSSIAATSPIETIVTSGVKAATAASSTTKEEEARPKSHVVTFFLSTSNQYHMISFDPSAKSVISGAINADGSYSQEQAGADYAYFSVQVTRFVPKNETAQAYSNSKLHHSVSYYEIAGSNVNANTPATASTASSTLRYSLSMTAILAAVRNSSNTDSQSQSTKSSQGYKYYYVLWNETTQRYEYKLSYFRKEKAYEYNWNYCDHLCSRENEDMMSTLKNRCVRFHLIPVDQVNHLGYGSIARASGSSGSGSSALTGSSGSSRTDSSAMSGLSAILEYQQTMLFEEGERLRNLRYVYERRIQGFYRFRDTVLNRSFMRPVPISSTQGELFDVKIPSIDDLIRMEQDLLRLEESSDEHSPCGGEQHVLRLESRKYLHKPNQSYYPAVPVGQYEASQQQDAQGAPAAYPNAQQLSSTEFVNRLVQGTDRYEWIHLIYKNYYHPREAYAFEVQWLVCNGVFVAEYVQSLIRRAKSCGFYLVQTPIVSNEQSDPFSIMIYLPLYSRNNVNMVKRMICRRFDELQFLPDSVPVDEAKRLVHRTGGIVIQHQQKTNSLLWIENKFHTGSGTSGISMGDHCSVCHAANPAVGAHTNSVSNSAVIRSLFERVQQICIDYLAKSDQDGSESPLLDRSKGSPSAMHSRKSMSMDDASSGIATRTRFALNKNTSYRRTRQVDTDEDEDESMLGEEDDSDAEGSVATSGVGSDDDIDER